MKLLPLLLITLLTTLTYAVEPGHEEHDQAKDVPTEKAKSPQGIYYGKVLEIKDVRGYKYLKVDENGIQKWVAIANAPVVVGDKIGYDKRTIMHNFESKSLGKKFKEIIFASDVYLPKKAAKPFVNKDVYTIEEVHMWSKDLKDQIISLEGTVSKVSHQIMKLDWVHLDDGTGNEKKRTDDLVFTATSSSIKAGDKVIAKGKVVVNKDFGYGYFYKVLIQDTTFEVK